MDHRSSILSESRYLFVPLFGAFALALSVQDLIASVITSWFITLVLAAFAFSGRLSGKMTKLCLMLAAALLWWRFSRIEELSQFDWLQWSFSMLTAGSLLGVVTYLAARAMEPELRDVLLFRHSPLFTKSRKRKINQKLIEFRAYLSNLGFELSTKKLPIGIGQTKSQSYAKDRVGVHHISLRAEDIEDLVEVTQAYSEYFFGRMFFSPNLPLVSGELIIRSVMGNAFGTYFNWSFWNMNTKEPTGWLAVFWEIRGRFGQDFTDKLLASAAISFLERPTTLGPAEIPSEKSVDLKHPSITRVVSSHLHR